MIQTLKILYVSLYCISEEIFEKINAEATQQSYLPDALPLSFIC